MDLMCVDGESVKESSSILHFLNLTPPKSSLRASFCLCAWMLQLPTPVTRFHCCHRLKIIVFFSLNCKPRYSLPPTNLYSYVVVSSPTPFFFPLCFFCLLVYRGQMFVIRLWFNNLCVIAQKYQKNCLWSPFPLWSPCAGFGIMVVLV